MDCGKTVQTYQAAKGCVIQPFSGMLVVFGFLLKVSTWSGGVIEKQMAKMLQR